jgi:pimeloyl-ACP methyl ester carboxylesterase
MMLDVRPAGARSMLEAFASADLRPILPTIAVPTLLIYGAEDVRAPQDVADAMHAAIPGSRLLLVPGAGHGTESIQETISAAFREVIRMAAVRDLAALGESGAFDFLLEPGAEERTWG